MAAFSFAKLKLRNKTFWLLFLMSGMMVPYAALMLPQYRAFQALNMTDSLWPLILPGFFGNISMMFFLIQYMKGISNSYFEAAKIDGANEMKQFLVIMLPLVKTAISAQIIFWFIGIWNDFFAPEIYLDTKEKMTLQPLLQRINTDNAGGGNYPMIMAGAVLASIPMMVIYITCQKYFIESLAISGVKG
jgi:multiple sugar transport system permease protein